MSDTMEEGVLVAWLAEEGASVSAGDVIAQVETDKATMDLEVYDDGVLLKRVVAEGAAVPIGALIAVLGSEGESAADVLAQYGGTPEGDGAATAQPEAPEAGGSETATTTPPARPAETPGVPAGYGGGSAPVAAPAEAEAQSATPASGGGRVKASPLARRMAEERGLDLASIAGTGPEGRVVKRDVEAVGNGAAPAKAASPAPAAQAQAAPAAQPKAAPAPAAPAAAPEAGATDVRITQMRKTIARRLAQSKFTAPHFYLTVEVDMTRSAAVRADLNVLAEANGMGRVSVNDLITKACAAALTRHPMVNASYLEDEGVIRQHAAAHVAVAVAMPEGLLTPVVRDANTKGLAQIAAETRDLATRAKNGQLDPSEYAGSTFTTSNLGMFGIEAFTAIVNPPNACILAIGATRETPVVQDGAVVPGLRMTLTLSCDHRVVDGATGAAFLGDVKALLEEPMRMLL